MSRFLILIAFFISFISLSLTAHAIEFRSDDSVSIQEIVEDDTFLTGKSIQVKAPIAGELFAAGNKIEILSPAQRSIYAAGTEVIVSGGAGYNVIATGNTVKIAGTIEHDVYLSGQFITIDKDAHIKGDVRIAGSRVILEGKIDGDVQVSAAQVESSAEIGGSLTGDMPALTFTGGKIGQDLRYRSNNEATGLDKVSISGTTDRSEARQPSQFGFNLRGFLTIFIVGAAIIFLMPHKLQEVTQSSVSQWGSSFVYGIVALLITPILFFLFVSSAVAWPLAVIWIGIVVILLYLAYIISHILIGQFILERIAPKQLNSWFSLIVGLILVTLLTKIPVVGGILIALIFIAITIPLFGASLKWWKGRLSV